MNSVAQSYDLVGGLREAADSLSRRTLSGESPPAATIVVVADEEGHVVYAPSANLTTLGAASLLAEALTSLLSTPK